MARLESGDVDAKIMMLQRVVTPLDLKLTVELSIAR